MISIPLGPIISILINMFALKSSTRYILTMISASTGSPILDFPGRRKGTLIYSAMECLASLIPFTIKGLSIVLTLA